METPRNVVDMRQELDRILAHLPKAKKENLTSKVRQSLHRTIDTLSSEDIGSMDPKFIISQILSEYDLLDNE